MQIERSHSDEDMLMDVLDEKTKVFEFDGFDEATRFKACQTNVRADSSDEIELS